MKSTYYSLFTTIWKAFWAWAVTAGIAGAATVAAVNLPDQPTTNINIWIPILLAMVPALIRVIENVRKNYSQNGPLWTWPWDKWTATSKLIIIIAAALAILLPSIGCAPFRITHPDGSIEEGWTRIDVTEQDIALWLSIAEQIAPLIKDDDATDDQQKKWDRFMQFLNSASVQAVLDNASQSTRDRIAAVKAAAQP